MKFILLSILSWFCISASAGSDVHHETSIIHSIDNYEHLPNYVEVSEEGLPQDHYLQLIQLIESFRFTLLTEEKVSEMFEELKNDLKARNRYPGGNCSYRRAYIQNLLKKKMNIISGRLLISCPANNGRLRLKDQVSGRYYSYSNFHDSNIVTVSTPVGNEFRIMDLQFLDTPLSLHDFLTEIETSQKIRPFKRRGSSTRLCYWTISTSNLTY